MKYYHLTLDITPEQCRTYQRSIVISEDPLDWEERQFRHPNWMKDFFTYKYREIPKDLYDAHKHKNPRKMNPKYNSRSFALSEVDEEPALTLVGGSNG